MLQDHFVDACILHHIKGYDSYYSVSQSTVFQMKSTVEVERLDLSVQRKFSFTKKAAPPALDKLDWDKK